MYVTEAERVPEFDKEQGAPSFKEATLAFLCLVFFIDLINTTKELKQNLKNVHVLICYLIAADNPGCL